MNREVDPKALDLKVVEFCVGLAGPLVGKYLADFGATVVVVETHDIPSVLRVMPPFKNREMGVDRSGFFAHFNANKYSISLDLKNSKGLDVAKRLAGWADVVVDNFRPGVMERWGLGYETLKKKREDIILVRNSGQGQTGPFASFAAYGAVLSGLAGFNYLTGTAERLPVTNVVYAQSDVVSPRLATAVVLAALDYRRRTGKGQYIDISELEASLHFLTPVLLDYTANGREAIRNGNSWPYASPHGVYRCKGEDRWCAISVLNDDEWRAFCNALDNPSWTREVRFSTLLGRKRHEDELNALVERWTSQLAAEDVMRLLQSAGVPAGVVNNNKDMCEDPQLAHRELLWSLKHDVIGEFGHLGQPVKLSGTPARGARAGPCLGAHTEYVATGFLGMPIEEFVEYLDSGAFCSLQSK